MTYGELKNKLEELRGKKRRLKQLEMQIAEEQASLDGIKAVNYESQSVQGGTSNTVQLRYIEHMERLCADRKQVLEDVFALEDFVAEHIKDLSSLEQSMLIDRYMNGKSWRKIQEEYGYEEAQPYRIVGTAIKKICLKTKDDSK